MSFNSKRKYSYLNIPYPSFSFTLPELFQFICASVLAVFAIVVILLP